MSIIVTFIAADFPIVFFPSKYDSNTRGLLKELEKMAATL